MRNSSIALAVLSLTLLPPHAQGPSPSPGNEIVLCGDTVPAELARANATFSVRYQLQTGDFGEVVQVTKLVNDVLPDGALVACLSRWRLPVQQSKAQVLLRWTHASGWTQVILSMPGYPSRTITINPGWQ
jgi:hypothetical protein